MSCINVKQAVNKCIDRLHRALYFCFGGTKPCIFGGTCAVTGSRIDISQRRVIMMEWFRRCTLADGCRVVSFENRFVAMDVLIACCSSVRLFEQGVPLMVHLWITVGFGRTAHCLQMRTKIHDWFQKLYSSKYMKAARSGSPTSINLHDTLRWFRAFRTQKIKRCSSTQVEISSLKTSLGQINLNGVDLSQRFYCPKEARA